MVDVSKKVSEVLEKQDNNALTGALDKLSSKKKKTKKERHLVKLANK